MFAHRKAFLVLNPCRFDNFWAGMMFLMHQLRAKFWLQFRMVNLKKYLSNKIIDLIIILYIKDTI